jgi:hypothetical protein
VGRWFESTRALLRRYARAVPSYIAIGAIVGSAWATPEATEEMTRALQEAGAAEPTVEPGEHLVDFRFRFDADDETDAQDVSNRIMMQAATRHGWMVTEIVPEEKEGDSPGDEGSRPVDQGPDA